MLTPEQEAKQYVADIRAKYYEFKRDRKSRMDVEWGKWSRKMNLELKDKMNTYAMPHSTLMKYVFFYWVNRSQLLELHHRHKIGKQGKKRELEKEAKDLLKIINSGDPFKDISDDEMKKRLALSIMDMV